MGSAYLGQEKYNEALEHFFLALEINQAENNEKWVSYNYNNIGDAYFRLKKYDQALLYFDKSLDIKTRLGDDENKIQTLAWVAEIYAEKNNYRSAYNYLQEHIKIKSSFQDGQRLKMADELEARFQSEKKEVEISALKAEQSLQTMIISAQKNDLEHQEQLRSKEKNLIYALGFILLSLIVTVIVFWRNNQQRKRFTEDLKQKNAEIEKVNLEIDKALGHLEEKNEEITDSINYAKRIQAAILPSKKTLASHLNEAFVLYLPKDIVAGDFYWTERVGDTILFAVADCTGHGVPGAMVSVVCHNALNSTTKQMGLTDPGEILDATTQLVLKQFEKSEEAVNDGMDIALCSFNTKTRKLHYAGANTPLLLVRDNEVIKYKSTRQPVGKYTNRVKFESNEIPIQKGDTIYMSSDGYSDQFGGEKGKKFLNKRLRELLITISKRPISEQLTLLHDHFQDWKQEYEQVDDVCILGARVDS
jgi:serine phosphatase RsbU (regulator of sigma subunit)